MSDFQEIIPGSTRVFNARIIDRDLVRNQGLAEKLYTSGATSYGTTKFGYGGNMTESDNNYNGTTNHTAFAIYHGGSPNYFVSGAVPSNKTVFGYGGNMTEVDAPNSVNVSYDQFKNGSNTLYGSGTVTVVTSGDIAKLRF